MRGVRIRLKIRMKFRGVRIRFKGKTRLNRHKM